MTITATLLAPAAAAAPGNGVCAERTAESGMPDFAAFLLENVPGLGARALAPQAKLEPGDAKTADEPVSEEANPDSARESAQLLAALPVFREMLPSASQPQPRTKGDEAEAADGAELAPSQAPAHRLEAAPALPAAATDTPHRPIEPAIPALEAAPTFHAATESRAPLAPSHPVATIATPVAHAAWNEELAAKVTWLATSRVQSAELRVQPPELGPVHVQIRIEANEANIALLAPHADTRDALEAALPDLRAALEARGIALGDASIGDSRGSGAGAHHASTHSAFQRTATEESDLEAAPRAARSLQLVDVFA